MSNDATRQATRTPDVVTIRRSRTRRLILPLALAAWMLTTATAFGWLWAYASTPGPRHDAPAAVDPSPAGTYSLLLFLHPECPCSRATLAELARLTARTQRRLAVRVLFVLPPGASDAWRNTSLAGSAAAIPGVTVSPDPSGLLARHYGAATSGHAILYAPDGHLVYSGGLTPSRGHEGDNPGSDAVLAAVLDHRPPKAVRGPTFGCTLFDQDIDPRNRKASDQ
jgi:hypothetical protein